MFTSTNRKMSTVFSNAWLKYLNLKYFPLLFLLITLSATKGVGQTYINMSSGNYSKLLTSTTGNRPKISIDNVAVTAVKNAPNLLIISDFMTEIKSIKSGNWNDPTTWDCTCVPTLSDNVHIRNPHIITVVPASIEQGCAKILIELGAVFKLQTGVFKINVPNINLAMGNPSGAIPNVSNPNNYLLEKPQYVMSYNRSRGISNWVSWYLGSSSLGSAPRQNDFRADTSLPSGWYQVSGSDYSGSGFDRGNITPSADRTSTVADNSATFLMTNVMPQAPDNNQGPWEQLESYLRTQVANNQEVYIISGSYGVGGTGSNGGVTNTVASGHVTVPSQLFKIAVILANGSDDVNRVTTSTRVIAVIMPNVQGIRNNDWRQYRTTVDSIEAATGYDFLSNVPPSIQSVIEAIVDNQ